MGGRNYLCIKRILGKLCVTRWHNVRLAADMQISPFDRIIVHSKWWGHQNHIISLCTHNFCASCMENLYHIKFATGVRPARVFHFTQPSCIYMFTRVYFSLAVVTMTCSTYNGYVLLLKHTCFWQRELKVEYFRGLNTQYNKRYLWNNKKSFTFWPFYEKFTGCLIYLIFSSMWE